MTFRERLNQVDERLLSPELLHNTGLGNEIGFYIFDYPPAEELTVRTVLTSLPERLQRREPTLRLYHLNLFAILIAYLRERKILHKAYDMQQDRGNEALLSALRAPLDAKKITSYLIRQVQPEQQDIVLLSGVGEAWPLLRSHAILNNLQPLMGNTPLVMFYPGIYDMQGLRLFCCLPENNYYRAFRLIS